MRKLCIATVLGIVLLSLPFVAPAQSEYPFYAELSGDQEVPPVETKANGFAYFTVDVMRKELAYQLSVSDIDIESVEEANIHLGARGEEGPVIFPLVNKPFNNADGLVTERDLIPQPDMGIRNFDDAFYAMLNGRTYINVSTAEHPDGEIRGQIQWNRNPEE